jgi:hypothetical protein
MGTKKAGAELQKRTKIRLRTTSFSTTTTAASMVLKWIL